MAVMDVILHYSFQHPLLFALVTFVCAIVVASNVSRPKQTERVLIDVPFNEPNWQDCLRWSFDTANLIQDAYTKFHGKIFQVWTSEGWEVIIPKHLIKELKSLPDNVLSASASMKEKFQAQYTTLPVEGHEHGIAFIKSKLTKNLGKYVPSAMEELDYVLQQQFQSYATWTPIKVNPKLIQIIASVSSRMIVGPELCRNKLWLSTIISYSTDVFMGATILKSFPHLLRPIVQFFLPQIWRLHQHNRTTAKIVKQALSRKKYDGEVEDAIHAMTAMLPESQRKNYQFIGLGLLGIAAAALHTTSREVTQMIYNLATHPEYITILRQELMEVLGQKAENLSLENINKLRKMDSFMKETIRMQGPLLVFHRKVLKPIVLSDGTYLPLNSWISVPHSSIAGDANNFSSPTTFDGLRFFKQRQASPTEANKHQFVSIDAKNMYFGAGKHACPGRFFAAMLIKMILAELLMRFDFELEDGEDRPEDWVFGGLKILKPYTEILIRDRVVVGDD
ncbi:hypothetical protein EG329_013759 [Mollisiaceae sp. DMI_Dod_QoI]|nr:hypothetical protein EG329_013759 [Helotiales sp. DMI_Dod_QoI]